MSSPVWNTEDMAIEHKEETYLTREDAAQLLNVTVRTVSRMLANRELQKYKLGNRIFLEEKEVLRMKGRRETLHPIP